MTTEELIKEYNRRILNAKDKKETTKKIVNEIVELKYSSREKIEILNAIKRNIIIESDQKFAQDNTKHLEIIDLIIAELKGGKQ